MSQHSTSNPNPQTFLGAEPMHGASAFAFHFVRRLGERMAVRAVMAAILGLIYLVAGCGGAGDPHDGDYGYVGDGTEESGEGCPEGGVGELVVDLDAPGLSVELQVWGPSGLTERLSSTQTLSSVPSGRYRVLADAAIIPATPGQLAGRVFSAGGSGLFEVCVRDRLSETVNVSYSEHPGSGSLWVAQEQGGEADLLAFHQDDVHAGGGAAPSVQIEIMSDNPSNNLNGLGFDRWGNLWAAAITTYGHRLIALTRDELSLGGRHEGYRVVYSDDFVEIEDIAFDAEGNLWVSADNTMLSFGVEQLVDILLGEEREVSEFAGVAIESPEFQNAEGIAFDSDGNLWIADEGADEVFSIAAPDLGASGSQRVSRSVVGLDDTTGGELSAPVDLAFTPNGDLWVSYVGMGVLAQYDSGVLDRETVRVTPNPLSRVGLPRGVTTDAAGGAWSAVSPSGLVRRGASNHSVTSPTLTKPNRITFYPNAIGH